MRTRLAAFIASNEQDIITINQLQEANGDDEALYEIEIITEDEADRREPLVFSGADLGNLLTQIGAIHLKGAEGRTSVPPPGPEHYR